MEMEIIWEVFKYVVLAIMEIVLTEIHWGPSA